MHLHVEDRVVVRLMAQGSHVAMNSPVSARVDHGRRAHGLHVPAKEAGEEVCCFGAVTAAYFKVDYGLSHGNFLSRNGENNGTASAGRAVWN
jgi:hypothetical protein